MFGVGGADLTVLRLICVVLVVIDLQIKFVFLLDLAGFWVVFIWVEFWVFSLCLFCMWCDVLCLYGRLWFCYFNVILRCWVWFGLYAICVVTCIILIVDYWMSLLLRFGCCFRCGCVWTVVCVDYFGWLLIGYVLCLDCCYDDILLLWY